MLKKLEIAGLKSFGRKTVLEFTTPVTAIVGPNGSGKSNIVEAIRFVLGEQSMKSLRGKAGTDLIFKGSKGVSAPSRASVAITFDNSSKVFSFSAGSPINIDFDEIIISREVYADGVNRYLSENQDRIHFAQNAFDTVLERVDQNYEAYLEAYAESIERCAISPS